MSNQNRERDLVLAPNEYAYISDQTKGHVVAYVGPYKTSMANTDQPVYFNEKMKRFVTCMLDEAIKQFTIVPEGWYVTLKNPPLDGKQPLIGTSNNLPKLDIGRKIHIAGPDFFALWPGQMVRVIKGHRLRTNQYLLVRVYEEAQATKNWDNAVIMPQDSSENTDKETIKKPNLPVGKLLVIKGKDVSFYIPPTGIEVVRDINKNYVRQAVTLERLEYCILLGEDGNKSYVKGPKVVIPSPTETFFVKNGQKKFKAIELSENSGIYVKVIAPYKEGKESYNIGDELFISGKEQMIYFPRHEHALIKDGDNDIYQAVAIPAGEGRYYLNRLTGQVLLQKGPAMFLPDPREAVIVQRVLTQKQGDLYYPGNKNVQEYNQKLRAVKKKKGSKASGFVQSNQVQQAMKNMDMIMDEKEILAEIASEEFVRSQTYTKARTITLDTKFQGAVTVDVWTGYAVLVTGKSGQRKVITGQQTYLLEYDESLAVTELSTGTPKTDDDIFKTVYLRVLHNKVSDVVEAETNDLCPVEISLSYRVNFTGDPEKWFNVENYVKFLTDHLRSKIRNFVQKRSISEFYANPIDIIRDIVLGKPNGKGERAGGKFAENGMHIYDVEILGFEILDEDIEQLLMAAQHNQVRRKLELIAKKGELDFTKENEEINREIASQKSTTRQNAVELQKQETEKQILLALERIGEDIKVEALLTDAKLDTQKKLSSIHGSELARTRATSEQEQDVAVQKMKLVIEKLNAEVSAVTSKAQAVSPDLIAALQAFGDKALAEKMAESMAPLSIIGGKSIAEVFGNLLKGTVLEKVLAKDEDIAEIEA